MKTLLLLLSFIAISLSDEKPHAEARPAIPASLSEEKQQQWIAAHSGNATAQYELAELYWREDRDAENHLKWLEKAVAQKHALACVSLGNFHVDNRIFSDLDPPKAAELYWMAINLGHYDGYHGLANLYSNGYMGESNQQASFQFLLMGAQLGGRVSAGQLGDSFRYGIGCAKDPEKAVFWYKKAIERGVNHSYVSLALMYYDGIGVEQDLETFWKLIQEGARKGSGDAHFWKYRVLSGQLAQLTFVETDYKSAFQALKESHRLKCFYSGAELATLYFHGEENFRIQKDMTKFLKYAKEAVEQNCSEVTLLLAQYRAENNHTDAALKLLEKDIDWTRDEALTRNNLIRDICQQKLQLSSEGPTYYQLANTHHTASPDWLRNIQKAVELKHLDAITTYALIHLSYQKEEHQKAHDLLIEYSDKGDLRLFSSLFKLRSYAEDMNPLEAINDLKLAKTRLSPEEFSTLLGEIRESVYKLLQQDSTTTPQWVEAYLGSKHNYEIKLRILTDLAFKDETSTFPGIKPNHAQALALAKELYNRFPAVEKPKLFDAINLTIVWHHLHSNSPERNALAVQWSQTASALGSGKAANFLSSAYHYGNIVPKDNAQSIHYAKLATNRGYAIGASNLAYFYEKGEGVETDRSKALALYLQSWKQGNNSSFDKIEALLTSEDAPSHDSSFIVFKVDAKSKEIIKTLRYNSHKNTPTIEVSTPSEK